MLTVRCERGRWNHRITEGMHPCVEDDNVAASGDVDVMDNNSDDIDDDVMMIIVKLFVYYCYYYYGCCYGVGDVQKNVELHALFIL